MSRFMSGLRIKNATLFVTVLGASLGLMAAGGASSHAHHTASGVLAEFAYRSTATAAYVSNQSPAGFTDISHPAARSSGSLSEDQRAKVFYRNTNPPVTRKPTLVITRLARASLDSERA